jgi:hypothetical protein
MCGQAAVSRGHRPSETADFQDDFLQGGALIMDELPPSGLCRPQECRSLRVQAIGTAGDSGAQNR